MKRKITLLLVIVVSTLKLNAQGSCTGNLLQGTSFETSTDMTYWTVATNEPNGSLFSTDNPYAICGSQYGYIRATDVSASPAWLVTVYQNATAIPGKNYTLTVYSGTHDPAQDQKILLQFYDASNNLLSGGQSVQVDNNVDFAPNALILYTLSGVAPSGAAFVRATASTQGTYTTLNTAFKFDCFCLTASALVLPVTGLSLSATPTKDCGINLAWVTHSEFNTKTFEIETSTDNLNFKSIGNVAAKGNSNTTTNYNFLHNALEKGIKYYRIKAIDNNDGSFSYSNTVETASSCTGNGIIAVYPNPAKSFVNVSGAELGSKLQLMDLSGRLLSQQNANGSNTDILKLEGFNSGTYFVRVVGLNGAATVVKLNKQ